MATSTNYGWAEPDNSSLVKNGASDIRTLGNAIDTSLWNSGFGQAGKNKIINGNFAINQRSFTTTTTSGAYGLDRWFILCSGGTSTYSVQQFTAGTAPVAGYEAKQYARLVTTGQSAAGDYALFMQGIEDVRTLAGQTATISFWAKASAGTPKVAVEIQQSFGSGGSPSATVQTYVGQSTLSTSWARYSISIAVPSISGKTVGTTDNTSGLYLALWTSAGTTYNARTGSLGIQSATIDFWGVQVEYGSYATPFQTATGTIQGELAACQRYYWRSTGGSAYSQYAQGMAASATSAQMFLQFPVTMRTNPTAIEFSTLQINDSINAYAVTGMSLTNPSPFSAAITPSVASGLTTYRMYQLGNNNSTSGYLGITAEL